MENCIAKRHRQPRTGRIAGVRRTSGRRAAVRQEELVAPQVEPVLPQEEVESVWLSLGFVC